MRRQSERVFIDDDREEILESEIELVKDPDTPLAEAPEPNGSRPDLDEVGRETNFTDTASLYEIVHPDGSGHGLYTTREQAASEARPQDLVAEALYTRCDQVHYTDEDS